MTDTLEVEVVYALPRCTHSLMLTLPPGSTVQEALDEACKHEPFSTLDLAEHPVGIYYEVLSDLTQVLEENDRIEIYRPLLVDPMQQRHARAKTQSGKP